MGELDFLEPSGWLPSSVPKTLCSFRPSLFLNLWSALTCRWMLTACSLCALTNGNCYSHAATSVEYISERLIWRVPTSSLRVHDDDDGDDDDVQRWWLVSERRHTVTEVRTVRTCLASTAPTSSSAVSSSAGVRCPNIDPTSRPYASASDPCNTDCNCTFSVYRCFAIIIAAMF